ncbi:cyclin-dependent kinase 20-like [Hetaerina americana]|uniref:cyclin-dependent kinase 20-like n=1 Tax=Hetaerina americana TaxID=62018 RepID=UPI003A7F6267
MDQYSILGRIGEGAHGLVMRAVHLPTNKQVALKKLLLKKLEDGISITVIREVKTLQHIDCKYVVQLLDVFPQGLGIVMVFEFMPADLWDMLQDPNEPLLDSQIKTYMQMLLRGVSYLHKNGVMHRDLKPSNLLISKDGVLKIADLGLARLKWINTPKDVSTSQRPYSHQVATRWYRAPELLYGARYYDEAVDLWAVGCIFGEILNRSPLFAGDNDIEQLCIVLQTLGTPTSESWPGMESLPDYNKITFPASKGISMEQLLPDNIPDAQDLVKQFLLYDSKKRIPAEKALQHIYFFSEPYPCSLEDMPKPGDDFRKKFLPKEYDVDEPIINCLKDLKEILG